ncbi:MAG: aminotransferase class I/II-fold pyridoxal phosphate-dependent enzyme, partial [Candidatus Eremiobacteraeota bacterium]|nr:aminotransferase class I/II-fold pyridoxal phosphate-dependent enzyme [Candidatus Eremiobacteraeota bacterium]
SADLRDALAARHGCSPDNIVVGAGIDDLLGLAVRAYCAPGEAAVTTLGSYPTIVYHLDGYGARTVALPYAYDGRVRLDELLERARTTDAKLLYLANPDNPSGSFLPRAEIERALEALPPRTLFVLDEAYADFVGPGDLLADVIDPRLVRMRTFSKAFGLAGARIGYAIGSRELAATFNKIRLQYNVNRTAQAGALAALCDEAFLDGVKAEVARGRRELEDLGRRLGLATLPSLTNFVCFDLGTRERAEAMVAALMKAAVFVRKPGAPPLDRCVRVTIGTAAERALFADRFSAALETLAEPASR